MKTFFNLAKVGLLATVVLFSNQALCVSEEFIREDQRVDAPPISHVENLKREVEALRRGIRSLENGMPVPSKVGPQSVHYSWISDDGRLAGTHVSPLTVGEDINRMQRRIYELELKISQREQGRIYTAPRFIVEDEGPEIGFRVKPFNIESYRVQNPSPDSRYKNLPTLLWGGKRNEPALRKFAQIIANISAKGFNIARSGDPDQWIYSNGIWYFDKSPGIYTPRQKSFDWQSVHRYMEEQFGLKQSDFSPKFQKVTCENILL